MVKEMEKTKGREIKLEEEACWRRHNVMLQKAVSMRLRCSRLIKCADLQLKCHVSSKIRGAVTHTDAYAVHSI